MRDLKSSREEQTAWSESKETVCAFNLEVNLGLLVHLGPVKRCEKMNIYVKMYMTTDENKVS